MKRFLVLLTAAFLSVAGSAQGQVLYGVTGDGASIGETLYTINTGTAAATFFQSLGNGSDGESIAYRSTDGLMYHWSGYPSGSSQVMETVNLTTNAVTNVATGTWGPYNPREVWGSTYDAANDRFLFTDINSNLGAVTAAGAFSSIGLHGADIRGLSFNGGSLFAGNRNSATLYTLNPLTGAITSTLGLSRGSGIISLTTDPTSGSLYAVYKGSGGRRLGTINTGSGAITDIGVLSDNFANIEFSRTVVPEPTSLLLLGPGLIGLLVRRRLKKTA